MKHRLLTCLFLLCSAALFSQVITPFTIRYQTTQKGGIRYISNTATTCTGGGCGAGRSEVPPAGTSTDNGFTAAYVDIDADGTTFMSSSDSLALATCSQISWAGLYWGGENTTGGSNYATRNQVKLKTNNGAYVSLTADALQDNAVGFNTYHCFKDITTIVQAGGTNARYTLANVAVRVGNTNVFGGWSIVVVYKNDLQPMRNLTVFNGLSNVSGSNPITDITVNGFLTPLSGPVTFEVGDLTYDGDRSSTGDQLMFNGGSGFVNISDVANPTNDIFNSTYSYNGVEKLTPFINPGYTNSLGYDADIFIPNNAAKNYIGNSATSATLRLTTGGETFLTQVVTIAIDVYEPDLRAACRVVDLNGGSVVPGDVLEYTIVGKNIGSDPSVNTFITDTLEHNAIYVPGSMSITYGPNLGAKTDAAGDDQAEYFAATNTIKVRVGTGANAVSGGQMNNSTLGIDSTQIKFRAVATTDCIVLQCDNIINNRAYIFGTGNVSGNSWSNGSNPDIFDGSGCPVPGTTNTPISAASCSPPAAGSNSPVCTGNTISLLSTPASTIATYSWTGPGGFVSTAANPNRANATAAMAGTYTCVITVPSSVCSYTVTTTVVINTTPATPAPSSNTPVCTGNTINLSTAAVAGATYSWTGPSSFLSVVQNPTRSSATVAMAGTYSITVTANGCTSAVGTTAVVVNTTPATPAPSSNTPVCTGNTINLSTAAVAGATYSWTGPSAFASAVQNPTRASATVAMAGTYSLTVTTNGCTSAVGTTAVVVNATPATPTASSNTPVCTGNTISISTPAVAGATYSWTGPNSFSSAVQNPSITTATIAMAGTYSITVTTTGCTSATGTTAVVVNATPATPTASSNSPVCTGNTINLSTPAVAGATYSWTGPNSFASAVQNPSITNATLAMAGTYSVTVTTNGCTSATGTSAVVVNATPATPTASSNSPVCTGNTINLSTPAVAGATYSWTGPNSFSSAVQNPSITTATIAMAGTYSITVTTTGCTSAVGTTAVVVNATPSTPTASSNSPVCSGNTINLSTPAVAGATYSWTGPNSFSSAVQNPSITTATIAMAGTYSITVTTTGCTSAIGTTAVVVNPPPTTSNAGPDQTICANTVTMAGNSPAIGTGTWTQISGPVAGTITTASSPTTTITGLTTAGTYVFQWTITNSPCSASSDQVSVIRSGTPTTSNAGPDQTICSTLASALMAGNVAVVGTGAWTQVSGPSTATITLPASPVTTITALNTAGTYVFQWTISNAPCTASSDQISIIVNAPPTTANAGPDQTICSNSVTMAGNTAVSGIGTWTQISGPAVGVITTPTSPSTTITGLLTSGTYVFQWTITNAPCSASSDQVSVIRNGTTPVSNAGPDQALCNSTTATMAGNAATPGTGTWTQISGPNTATITTPSSQTSTMTGLIAGTYVFQWTITNAPCAATNDQVSIVISDLPSTSNAGTDQIICNSSATMAGNIPASGTGIWSQISGPNSATITTASSPATTMTGLIAGTYIFQWTISNGSCAASSDQVTVTVNAAPTTSNAGPDQMICSSAGSALMSANTALIGTGTWTQISGPATGTITSPNSPSTTISGLTSSGTYVFEWAIANGVCVSSTDQMSVVVNDPPTIADAGSDQELCSATSATMNGNTAASGTGTWSQISGPLGTTIVALSSPTTSINGLATGTYVFQWEISNSPCAVSDDQVTIIIDGSPSIADAGADQNVCSASGSAVMAGNTPSTGTGTWLQISGPATASITTPSSEISGITGLTVAGTYDFQWSISNGVCAASTDLMQIVVLDPPAIADAGTDQQLCNSTTTNLAGNIALTGSGMWSQISGPNTATMSVPASESTSLTNLVAGTYIFQWTISNAPCASTNDQVQIDVFDLPTASNAGSDQNLCNTTSATMAGNTATTGTGTWSQFSGPNSATITTPSLETTTITNVVPGTYVFVWTISNGVCSPSTDSVNVIIDPLPTTASAGTDILNACPPVISMSGNTPVNGTGMWTQFSGPNSSTINSPASATTTIGNIIPGTYVFVWTITSGSCGSSSDTVQVVAISCDSDGDGVPDVTEISDGTDPNNPCEYIATSVSLTQGGLWNAADCDGDGVTNGTEVTDGTDPNNSCDYLLTSITLTQGGNWSTVDCDGDGVINSTEITDGTNPNNPCDYIASSTTLPQGGNWNVADCDGDGVTNGTEITDGTNPADPCNFLAGSITLTPGGNWNVADCDGDGVINGTEIADGTNPNNPCDYLAASVTLTQGGNWNLVDCDGDGVINGTEIVDGTNPNDPCDYLAANITLPQSGNWNTVDCDGDGVINGTEITDGTNPNNPCDYLATSETLPQGGNWNAADCDGDGVTNGTEISDGTNSSDPCDYLATNVTLPQGGNWNTVDCDGDGVINGTEITDGTNPADPCSFVATDITLTPGANWNIADCDGDGVTNGTEITDGTDPGNPCDYVASSSTLSQGGNWNAADCDGDGVTNGTEITDGTNSADPCDYISANVTLPQGGNWNTVDCDGDGVINGTEITDGTNPSDPCSYVASDITLTPNANWNAADCDGDGVINGTEITNGTNPNNPCDYLASSITLPQGGNWNTVDCDGDGVINGTEIGNATDPNNPCDYLASSITLTQGGNWNTVDCDGDGVINGTEITNATDPNNPCDYLASSITLPQGGNWNTLDCDGDGVINGTEITNATDPNNPCDYISANITLPQDGNWNTVDCDGDGVTNGTEVGNATDPNNPCDYLASSITLPQGGNWNTVDCDGDGVINGTEIGDGTNPADPCSLVLASQSVPPTPTWNGADCDGDGITNGGEVSGGSNPFNACDPNPCDLIIPQGFSPNGDGINDIFEIKGITIYPNNNVTIFNRWGNLVYQASGYDNNSVKWDGTNQGTLNTGSGLVPEGTYFYTINLGDGSAVLSGYIFVNRQ
jgi:gliding motility-associated-like protein